MVLKGSARIAIRPVYGRQVHLFDVSGDRPAFVDIPTLHTHNITNVGDGELITVFWAARSTTLRTLTPWGGRLVTRGSLRVMTVWEPGRRSFGCHAPLPGSMPPFSTR